MANLNFVFKSYDHIRYENGKPVSGPHGRARRVVKVEPNIENREGCTVTIYNMDGAHPVWQNNIQMAPKQMRIMKQTAGEVVLKGFGRDALGASFSDYGLTIRYVDDEVEECTLHMYDRSTDIVYMKYTRENELEEQRAEVARQKNADLIADRKRRASEQKEFTTGRIDISLCMQMNEVGMLNFVKKYSLQQSPEWSYWLKIVGTWNDDTVYRMSLDPNDTREFPLNIGQVDVEFVQTREEYIENR